MSRAFKFGLLGLAAALCALAPSAASADASSVIVKYRSAAGAAQVGNLADAARPRPPDRLRPAPARRRGRRRRQAGRGRRAPRALAAGRLRGAQPHSAHRRRRPTTPLFGDLYGLNNTGQTGGTADADIDAPEGWDAAGLGGFPSTGGVKVGIVDTGIQANHPDLAGKVADCARSQGLLPIFSGTIQEGICADDNGHGTHVAGTITANANNGDRRRRRFVQLAAVDLQGARRAAGHRLDRGRRQLHHLGARQGRQGDLDEPRRRRLDDAEERRRLRLANGGAGGSVLVAAAGNDGDATLNYPAAYPNVVSVAATDNSDARASFSNANADVEVAAPGVDITSTWNDGGYNTISGTSMATPHAAGVTAVIRARYPSATAAQIVAKLDGAVDDLGAAGRDSSFGFGRVNLVQAATE